ncbi:MAG: formate dehydrogenase accessory sulfurtransferase FdhD [Hyphomicrobiaceae bacterium]|nr:formate dehydrogenase accessory sulfurtransferase FdhD [Hyphomicrobiaceae bacterium]
MAPFSISPLRRLAAMRVGRATSVATARVVPEETAVALVFDGATHAVMMASPADLEDYAVGFALTEGKIAAPDDIIGMDIVVHEAGIEARLWLEALCGRTNALRRRAMLGPTGCGLCGIESLEQALPPVPRVDEGACLTAADVAAAVASLRPAQVLNAEAAALHAAGLWRQGSGLVVVREDVGRHNALDKLAGALAREGTSVHDGIIVLTSRVSVEMVQKAAMIGATVVVAVSAPTALAVRTAEAAGITLVGIARADAFEVFTHAHRITDAHRDGHQTEQGAMAHAVC